MGMYIVWFYIVEIFMWWKGYGVEFFDIKLLLLLVCYCIVRVFECFFELLFELFFILLMFVCYLFFNCEFGIFGFNECVLV